MNSLKRFSQLFSSTLACCAFLLTISAIDANAQSQNGTNPCPTAERLEREAVLLQLNCDYRLNVIETLQGQVPEVEANVDRDDISTRQSRIYENEVRVLNNRIRVAQRSANVACRAVQLRLGTVDRAQATCDASVGVNTDAATK
jgi:hypothetical protein